MGPFGNPERNSNGEKLLDLCSINRLRVLNTFFKHKTVDTWQHTRYKTWHTLDYILARTNDFKKVCDVKVVCDAHCDTDHRLLRMKVKLRTRFAKTVSLRKKSTGRPRKLQINKLQHKKVNDELVAKINDKLEKRHNEQFPDQLYKKTKGGLLTKEASDATRRMFLIVFNFLLTVHV